MTETELNEKIGELTENDSDEEDRIRRMKRSRRRYLKYLKNDRLLRIIIMRLSPLWRKQKAAE